MERWGISANSLYFRATIHKEVGPWYAFFFEWLSLTICGWMPDAWRDWWHYRIDYPIFNWCQRRYQSTMIEIDLYDVPLMFDPETVGWAIHEAHNERAKPISDSPAIREKYQHFLEVREQERNFKTLRKNAEQEVIDLFTKRHPHLLETLGLKEDKNDL